MVCLVQDSSKLLFWLQKQTCWKVQLRECWKWTTTVFRLKMQKKKQRNVSVRFPCRHVSLKIALCPYLNFYEGGSNRWLMISYDDFYQILSHPQPIMMPACQLCGARCPW